MKIPEFGTLQMVRTNAQHFGTGNLVSAQQNANPSNVNSTFKDYLLQGLNTVNTQQNDVSKLQEQLITDPDSVDVHDVTIAMQKARMSLNLAQTVIDRLVTDWNEITTTR